MEFDKIIQLIKTVSDSNLTQFSMEEGSLKISMKTNKQTKIIAAPMMHLLSDRIWARQQAALRCRTSSHRQARPRQRYIPGS